MKMRIVLVAVLALSLTEAAFAQQPASSFTELASTLKVSDYVQVADRNGKKVTGTVASITGSSLSLSVVSQVTKRTRTFSDVDVVRVTKIHRDSTLNGKLIGGAAGAAVMLAAMFSGGGSDIYADGGAAIFGGIVGGIGFGAGAWIGGAIDGHINKQETVFKSTNSSTHLFDVKPLVSKQGKRVAVSMRF